MHIADGVLPAYLWISGNVFSGTLALWTLSKKTNAEDIPYISLVTAAVFVASLLHVPIGPVSAHFILNGLAGITLGILSFPAIVVALTLQAVLFQFGGFTTIGINAVVMGVPALAAWGIFRAGQKTHIKHKLGIFAALAGGIAIALGTLLFSLCLLMAGKGFQNVVPLAVISHLPIMVIEAVVCYFFAEYVGKIKPELLEISLGKEFFS